MGTPAARAKWRLSCSFWLEAIPGSSAETMTSPPVTPVYAAVNSTSAATLRPTCFIVTMARAPAKAAPRATSIATFSLGAHWALPPSCAKVSRISVDGVPG